MSTIAAIEAVQNGENAGGCDLEDFAIAVGAAEERRAVEIAIIGLN
jgi:hypothetical protein